MDMYIPNEAKISYRQVQLSSRHTSTHMYCTSWTKEERRKETLSFFRLPLKRREKGCSKKSFISSQAEESSIRSTQQSERANNPADQHSLCVQKETQINCFTLFPPHFEVNCKYSGHSLRNDRTGTCTSRIYRCVRVYESTV